MKLGKRNVLAGAMASLTLAAAPAIRAQAPDKVRFSLTGLSMLYTPVYIADVMGYFAEERIVSEVHHFKAGGAAALAAVLGGNMEVYIGAASSAMRSASKGSDVQLIASSVTRYSIDIIMRKQVAEARGFKPSMTDKERYSLLKGLKIGVSGAGSGTHQIVQFALQRAGLNSERDATMVFLGESAATLSAFVAGRIDAAATSSPASEIAMKDHGAALLVNGPGNGWPELDGFLYVALISNARWTKANPELATRTVRAFLKAHKAMQDPVLGPQARDKFHAKYFDGTDKGIFDAAWERMLPGFPTDLRISPEQMVRVQKFLNEFSTEKLDSSYAQIADNRFVEAAMKK